MIPAFLERFSVEIEKYRLEAIRIIGKPIKSSKSLLFTQSKFLGKPFLPLTQEYPKSNSGVHFQ